MALLVPPLCAALSGDALARQTEEPAPVSEIRKHRFRPPSGGENWLGYRIDFGPRSQCEERCTAYDGSRFVAFAAWRGGVVRAGTRSEAEEPNLYLRDFVEGEDATLLLAADSLSTPTVILTLGDAAAPRGPVSIFANGELVAPEIETDAGEFVDVQFSPAVIDNRIEIRLETAYCRTFALNGAAMFLPGRAQVVPRFPPLADRDEIQAVRPDATVNERKRARAALRAYAEYLLRERTTEGCFALSGNWYESSYPVRTLLAAADILKEPRFREAAFECLDRFVEEQHEDGSWASQFFGRRSCEAALAVSLENLSRNLADVGTVAVCLPVAAGSADPARREAYRSAAIRYAETQVLPAQLESGAFPNGLYLGTHFPHPYSVATGVQATNLSVLFAVTGDRRYLVAAERAAVFLARSIQADGALLMYPHDEATPKHLAPDRLGDIFYVIEGLFYVYHYADPVTRDEIREALDRYFEAPGGLSSWREPATWMSAGNTWENAKRAGVLFLLSEYLTIRKPTPAQRQWLSAAIAALEDPRTSRAAGVRAAPEGHFGRHCFVATGFAGLGMAHLVNSKSIYPARRFLRPASR